MDIELWVQRQNELNQRRKILEGEHYKVTEKLNGTSLHIDIDAVAAAVDASYSGPFQVVKLTDTSVRIYGNNASEGRNWYNDIVLGINNEVVAETEPAPTTPSDVTGIGSAGYVMLEVTYSTQWDFEYQFSATLTAQSNTAYYIPIAWLDWEDGAISTITQLQRGIIQGAGRVF